MSLTRITGYIYLDIQMRGLSHLFNTKEGSRIAAELFISASLNFSNKTVIYSFKTEGAETAAPKVLTSRAWSLISSGGRI